MTALGTYNVLGKAVLLLLSVLAIVIVRGRFVDYHHAAKDNLGVSYMLLVPATFVTAIIVAFDHSNVHSFIDSAYVFSRVLESVAIAPQIVLLSRLQGASRVVVSYVAALALYRLLYIFNWMWCVLQFLFLGAVVVGWVEVGSACACHSSTDARM